jgi:hypothetical protein
LRGLIGEADYSITLTLGERPGCRHINTVIVIGTEPIGPQEDVAKHARNEKNGPEKKPRQLAANPRCRQGQGTIRRGLAYYSQIIDVIDRWLGVFHVRILPRFLSGISRFAPLDGRLITNPNRL